MTLVASARMYAVADGAASAWTALLVETGRRAGVRLTLVPHAYPAPLSELWGRPDLGCAFMCGWPLAQEAATWRAVIAAPVPDAAWSGGQPMYRSDFLVARHSPVQSLEDSFGGRFAYNARGSHSGYNLPHGHFARWSAEAPLFASLVGPLTTPRRCIEAVADGLAELTAVDSFAWQLLTRHDPTLAGRVRVVASTGASPIPPLVGGPMLDAETETRLRDAFLGLASDPAGRALLQDLCLLGFVTVDRAAYDATLAPSNAARDAGYPYIA